MLTTAAAAYADDALKMTYAGSMGVVMDKGLGPRRELVFR